MNGQRAAAFTLAILGSVIIGLHFGSPMLGIGVYFCIAAAGSWN